MKNTQLRALEQAVIYLNFFNTKTLLTSIKEGIESKDSVDKILKDLSDELHIAKVKVDSAKEWINAIIEDLKDEINK